MGAPCRFPGIPPRSDPGAKAPSPPESPRGRPAAPHPALFEGSEKNQESKIPAGASQRRADVREAEGSGPGEGKLCLENDNFCLGKAAVKGALLREQEKPLNGRGKRLGRRPARREIHGHAGSGAATHPGTGGDPAAAPPGWNPALLPLGWGWNRDEGAGPPGIPVPAAPRESWRETSKKKGGKIRVFQNAPSARDFGRFLLHPQAPEAPGNNNFL